MEGKEGSAEEGESKEQGGVRRGEMACFPLVLQLHKLDHIPLPMYDLQ